MTRLPLWLALVALTTGSCGKTVDLTTALQVADVSTGWWDAGITNDGKNKIVPAVAFKFKNVSTDTIGTLQANVVFRHAADDKEWGSFFVKVTGSDGLTPGAMSELQRVHCPQGFTGTESRQQMLQNSQFGDAKAQVFAKYGSTQWKRMGEYPIERRLIEKSGY
jgi:hypothetical protein